jgi:hypothetical protein
MPVLNPGAPPFVSADSQTYIAALRYYGQDWLVPSAIAFDQFTVDMSALAAAPQPADPGLNPEDLLASLIPGNFMNPVFLVPKMRALVERYLYDQNVSATGVEPPPADTPTETPPTTYVEPEPPTGNSNLKWISDKIALLLDQLLWMRKQMTTRTILEGNATSLTGKGEVSFGSLYIPDDVYSTEPMGYEIEVTAYPDYASQTDDSHDALLYAAGEVSWGWNDAISGPFKIMRRKQIIWPLQGAPQKFIYNLPENVTILVTPLYPEQYDQHIRD